MKLVVTGTRGIPDIMGGVETHCEELFPRIAAKGVDTTLIRRKDYVRDSLTEWKGGSWWISAHRKGNHTKRLSIRFGL